MTGNQIDAMIDAHCRYDVIASIPLRLYREPPNPRLSKKQKYRLRHPLNRCPRCSRVKSRNSWYEGYGLAGGGIGAYSGCNNCGFFDKVQDSDA